MGPVPRRRRTEGTVRAVEVAPASPHSTASGPQHAAVQITCFGGREVLEIVDVPEPTPGPGQQLYDVSTAGINYADTHHRLA